MPNRNNRNNNFQQESVPHYRQSSTPHYRQSAAEPSYRQESSPSYYRKASVEYKAPTSQPKRPPFQKLLDSAGWVYDHPETPTDSLRQAAAAIGGKVAYNLTTINPETGEMFYPNACAIRMSYILQQNGYRIPRDKFGKTSSGADKLWYLVLVKDMINYIETIWKDYPSTKLKYLKDPREIIGKKGLLIFTVINWGNASGHVTLWDGEDCYDHCYFQNNLDKNHRNDKPPLPRVTEIRFWEMQ